MIIFGAEHERTILAALSLSRALLKTETLPVLCSNLTTSSPLKIPYGKSDLTIFSSEIVRTIAKQSSHLDTFSSLQLDFSINAIGCINMCYFAE